MAENKMKVELSAIQMLEFIIVGIKNRRYQAALNLAQDCIDELKEKEKRIKKIKEE